MRKRLAAVLAALILGTSLTVVTAPAAQGYSGSLWVSLSAERYPHGAYLAQGRNYVAFDSCAQSSTSG